MKIRTVLVAAVTCLMIIGCVQHTMGTKIEQDKVSQIKKGVTTKAEVAAAFGQPVHVSIMGEGRRMMMYHYLDMSGKELAFSGVVSQRRTQQLQIILNKNDVVEDYEFSDNVATTEKTGPFQVYKTTTVAPENDSKVPK